MTVFGVEAKSDCTATYGEGSVTEVSFESFDGSVQHAALFQPRVPANPAPLLVTTHGWGQSRCDYLEANMAAKAGAEGWFVLSPAYRDEDGLNNDEEVNGRWLPSFVPSLASITVQKDVISAIDWVKSRHAIDGTRVYVSGESMGGMMAMIMAEKYPDVFAAAIDWIGITDLAAWALDNNEVSPRIDDNDPNLVFTGSWAGQRINGTSNNYVRATNDPDASVSFSFEGNWVAYIGSLGPEMGKARVEIDGSLAKEIDLTAAQRIFGVYFYFGGLTDGRHQVKVSAQAAAYIGFDGFDYGDGDYKAKMVAGVYDDSDSRAQYFGQWQVQGEGAVSQPVGSLLGGKARVALTTGSYLTFNFSGNMLGIIHARNKNLGIAKVEIDGAAYEVDMGPPDQYFESTEDKYFHVLTVFRDLPSGDHVLKMTMTGNKNAKSVNNLIAVDGFVFGDNLIAAPYRHYQTMTQAAVGAVPDGALFAYQRRSPISYLVNLRNTPVKAFYSRKDSLVRFSQAELLKQKYQEALGKALDLEETAWGHYAEPSFRARKVFEFFSDKRLNTAPANFSVKTDESKDFYWLEIDQGEKEGEKFTQAEVIKELGCEGFLNFKTVDEVGFSLGIDLAEAVGTTEVRLKSGLSKSLAGGKLKIVLPAGENVFWLKKRLAYGQLFGAYFSLSKCVDISGDQKVNGLDFVAWKRD